MKSERMPRTKRVDNLGDGGCAPRFGATDGPPFCILDDGIGCNL